MTTTDSSLDLLAAKIKDAISRSDKSRAEWIEASFDLCVSLAEARAAFPSDIAFGQWFDSAGIDLEKNTRAAAVAMGKEPDRLRSVLAATTRLSLRHIYEQEFRFPHVGKPASDRSPLTAQAARLQPAIRAELEAGRTPNLKELGREYGVTDMPARRAMSFEQGRLAGIKEVSSPTDTTPLEQRVAQLEAELAARAERERLVEELDAFRVSQLAAMTPTQRKKFDRQVVACKQELDWRIASQISAGIRKWEEESGIALYMKRLDQLEHMLTTPNYAVMRKKEYNAILFCLHPDTSPHRTTQDMAEAFRILSHYKLKLINDEEERVIARRELRSQMPKTLQEMLARRKTKRA